DVDFCLRVRDQGWLNVWTPDARLYHHESKTRGLDDEGEALARFHREIALFVSVWGNLLKQADPYYSPHLTLTNPNGSIRDERPLQSRWRLGGSWGGSGVAPDGGVPWPART